MDAYNFVLQDRRTHGHIGLLSTGYLPQPHSQSELRYLESIGLMPRPQAETLYIENQSGSMISLHNEQYTPRSLETYVFTETTPTNHASGAMGPLSYSGLGTDSVRPPSSELYTMKEHQQVPVYIAWPPDISAVGMADRSLRFSCENQEGIRLDLALRGDMQGLSDPNYRGFFEGFGDKASFKLYMPDGKCFTRQKNCKHMLNRRPAYITRAKIVVEVAKFVQDFVDNDSYSGQGAIFADWPTGRVELGNFVLVELRRVSKASVQPIFRYRPSGPA